MVNSSLRKRAETLITYEFPSRIILYQRNSLIRLSSAVSRRRMAGKETETSNFAFGSRNEGESPIQISNYSDSTDQPSKTDIILWYSLHTMYQRTKLKNYCTRDRINRPLSILALRFPLKKIFFSDNEKRRRRQPTAIAIMCDIICMCKIYPCYCTIDLLTLNFQLMEEK